MPRIGDYVNLKKKEAKLLRLPYFNSIRYLIVDLMHCLFLRIAHLIIKKLWIDGNHHEVFDKAYHVSIYAKCKSTPKNVEIQTLCQPTLFKMRKSTYFRQCWYGTMSKENFNVLNMSWTLSQTCPVQVSYSN